MNASLVCQSEERRHKVREAQLNGLDYIEVSDDQRELSVYFLGKAPADSNAKEDSDKYPYQEVHRDWVQHVRITGGRRKGYRAPEEVWVKKVRFVRSSDRETDDRMIVTVNKPGDFSTYSLQLVDVDAQGRPTNLPFPGFDSRYAHLDFNFKAGCPSDLDCKPRKSCPLEPLEEPEINYVAKDYASFYQLILDRLALIMPDWTERHEADIGITLVELLAYAGDYLSYHQDAVATEAYLDTARQRISVRRHVQLVDYVLHEGCNARAFVFVAVDPETNSVARQYQIAKQNYKKVSLDSNEFFFITGYPNVPQQGQALNRNSLRDVPSSDYLVFEPLVGPCGQKLMRDAESGEKITFYEAHNEIRIYTWGDSQCCLPKGSTSATLRDEWVAEQPGDSQTRDAGDRARLLNLKPGDFLLFEEVLGPKTGNAADADPTHRQVVRLTGVTPRVDQLYGENGQPILEIEWDDDDALRFPLCISTIGVPPECRLLEDVSISRGNIILTDHGRTVEYEPLGLVPIGKDETTCLDVNKTSEVSVSPGQFRPKLKYGPLTSTQTITTDASASCLATQDPRAALPCVQLCSTPVTRDGRSMASLLDIDNPSELIIQLRICDQYTAQCLVAQLSIDLRRILGEKSKDDPVSADEVEKIGGELRKLCNIWEPRQTLIDSRSNDAHFVAEIDNDGRANLRFGDGEFGRQPQAGSEFRARYRVGNGTVGNVGAGSIRHMVFDGPTVPEVRLVPRNPLAASGGTEPESLTEARQFAPHTFRRILKRAITPDDYSRIVMRDFGGKVQQVAATLQWTGSGFEVLLAIDVFDQFRDESVIAELLDQIHGHLYGFRRIGHDLRVELANLVPLDIVMTVCVHRDYLPGEVKDALQKVFSNRINPDGSRGFFHPDNLSFGEGIHSSRLVSAAQSVAGVENVIVKKLERLFEGPNGEMDAAILPLGPLEIARLDNDPNFPENGKLEFEMQGGR